MASLTDRPRIHNQTSCLSDQADVTGRLGRSRRQKNFLSPKKIAERFFLASTFRVFIPQDDRGVKHFLSPKKNRGAIFFGVDR